jgi:hypothetical protein
MKIYQSLSGVAVEGQWQEPLGIRAAMHDEPQPGFIRLVSLGPRGLSVKGQGKAVAFPLSELMKLAEQAEPALKPKPAGPRK